MSATTTDEIVTGNHYNKYEGGNVAIRFLTKRFLVALDELFDAVADEGPITRILEVGCGEGEIAERLRDRFPEASVTALDLPDPDLRREWEKRSGVEFLEGDAHDLQFEDDSFDLVVAVEVCEHLTHPWSGLAEMARVSKRHLVLTVPREPLFRMGNFLTGRHVSSFGNTPGHFNHWGTPGFLRFVSVQAAIANVRLPLPWTAVHARVDA
ncbi:class I SAM-dependent methyltransferase [Euzebya tangerina]|uniref:class I SAM-dependent methyltransferase n=1 Tax=Euzebya tangerina TaxID=591198 RepID=UPI000E31AB31|nr:class I SAM-dependent methyltransferase [Euzebya tangerina]